MSRCSVKITSFWRGEGAGGRIGPVLLALHLATAKIVTEQWIPVLLAFSTGCGVIASLVLGKLYDRSPLPTLLVAVFLSSLFSPFAFFGGSAALSLRIASNVVVGGEVWYLRHYDAANLTAFTGDAVMLGPTLYVQFTPKMFMTAAWNTQVWGREVGNAVSLNLAEFQRNRARLKFAVEF